MKVVSKAAGSKEIQKQPDSRKKYKTPNIIKVKVSGVSKPPDSRKKKEVEIDNRAINFKIVYKHGTKEKIFFMTKKKNSRLLKTKDKEQCANGLGNPIDSLKFLFKEKRVKDSDTPRDLGMVDGDIIEVHQKQPCIVQLDQEPPSRIPTNKSGDGGDGEEKLKLNKDDTAAMAGNHHKCGEPHKDMASDKNVIQISSDEETLYIEQEVSHVEEQIKNNLENVKSNSKEHTSSGLDLALNYNVVYIEMETMLASNNNGCKEITQIGGFKEKSIGISEARFFKAIEPKKLNHYLENYKLGGDLLQTLHMQKNQSGVFEFRKQFEIMGEGVLPTQCVGEEQALEELSSYLGSVENCIIVSLNEENIKLLVNKVKLLSNVNKKIHIDSVKGFSTWGSYLRESGGSQEDLNQEFEDWYDGHVKTSSCSEESLKKHADVVAKMVHDSITARSNQDASQKLVKASRPINLLMSNQMQDGNEQSESETQYLELFSSLRPDFPVTISLKKLETYDISSDEDDGDTRNRNERNSGGEMVTKIKKEYVDFPNVRSEKDSRLVRLAKNIRVDWSRCSIMEKEVAKLSKLNKTERIAKLNHARRWTEFDKNERRDWFGDTAIIAAAREGKVNMVGTLLTAGADPTLEARINDVTEDAVSAAQNQFKIAEAAAKEAEEDITARRRLEGAKSTLELLLVASKYWTKATYAGVQYSDERSKAFAKNPNMPTDQPKLQQEIEAFFETKEQKRRDEQKRQVEKRKKTNDFTTTLVRNDHFKDKHKSSIPNNIILPPIETVPSMDNAHKRQEEQKRQDEERKKNLESGLKCHICNKDFTTTLGRNLHIKAKHNPGLILPPIGTVSSVTTKDTIVPNAPTKETIIPNAPTKDTIVPNAPTKDTIVPNAPTKDTIVPNAPTKDTIVPNAPTKDTIHRNAPTKDTIVPAAPTKDTIVPNAPTKDALLEPVPTQDENISGVTHYHSNLPYLPWQENGQYNLTPYAPGYNPHWTGYGNFGQGFGQFHQPYHHLHPDFGVGGFGQFRLTHPEFVNGGFGPIPPHPENVNGGFGRFPTHPEQVNGGFGHFRPPHPEHVTGGFGRFCHPQSNQVSGTFGRFRHPPPH